MSQNGQKPNRSRTVRYKHLACEYQMRSSLTVRIDNGRIIFGESFFSAADCRDRKDMSNIGWPVGSDEMTNCSKIVTYFQAQPIISRVSKFHRKCNDEQGVNP